MSYYPEPESNFRFVRLCYLKRIGLKTEVHMLDIKKPLMFQLFRVTSKHMYVI